MYKVGDKLILIKEVESKFGTITKYTLNHSYRIMKINNFYYLENDESSNDWKDWGIWSIEKLNLHFKNIRDERLKKLKQLNESNLY